MTFEEDPDAADREIAALVAALDSVLKKPDVGAVLDARGINTSLALLVIDGLLAYLQGKKKQAAEDLATAAEEIEARLRAGSAPPRPGSLPS
jgi:hypothetical protein